MNTSETTENEQPSNSATDSLNYEELLAYLNNETGKINWKELQPHFARGALLHLETGFDLIDTAAALIRDDKSAIFPMIEEGVLGKLADEKAQSFADHDRFWAVVVAPWVLIQPLEA